LQKIAAEMFGMEASLFVPSGTMSNLIAGKHRFYLQDFHQLLRRWLQMCCFPCSDGALQGARRRDDCGGSSITNPSLSFLLPALLDCEPSLFVVDMSAVETNILRFRIKDSALSPQEFCARMGQVGVGEEVALGQGVQVLMYPHHENSIRAVWHLGISPEDTQLAIKKMQFVAAQLLNEQVKAQ
ncbi:hypothetical protein GOODEAATRI_006872, partial [Goodea atripinnis]